MGAARPAAAAPDGGARDAELTVAEARGAVARLNPAVNAVLHLDAAAAPAGPGPLAGRPVLVKDCIDVAGLPTTHGAAGPHDAPAARDAFVVARLRAAGGVVLGKAHLTEFCFGAVGDNAHHGPCRNPWDLRRIPGGSSSGSAAAVASGMVDLALGTDTGGSVRVPAALCGVVGLRPTLGRVSNTGVLPLSLLCDTVGLVGRTVRDCARLFDAVEAYDPQDPVSQPFGGAAVATLDAGVAGLRVGLPRPFFFDDLEPDIGAAVQAAARGLERDGATLVDLPLADPQALAAHNSFRFVLADVAQAREPQMRDGGARLGAQVRARIALGQAIGGAEYAACLRTLWAWKAELRALFADRCDVLLTPTTPVTAPLWAEAGDMVATTRRVAGLTYDIGAAGVPALSVPVGLDRRGLPIGAQVAAPWGADALAFRVAQAVERRLGLLLRPAVVPDLFTT